MQSKEARLIYEQNRYKREGVTQFLKRIEERALDGYSYAEFYALDLGVDNAKGLEEMGYGVIIPKDSSRTATIKVTR